MKRKEERGENSEERHKATLRSESIDGKGKEETTRRGIEKAYHQGIDNVWRACRFIALGRQSTEALQHILITDRTG